MPAGSAAAPPVAATGVSPRSNTLLNVLGTVVKSARLVVPAVGWFVDVVISTE